MLLNIKEELKHWVSLRAPLVSSLSVPLPSPVLKCLWQFLTAWYDDFEFPVDLSSLL